MRLKTPCAAPRRPGLALVLAGLFLLVALAARADRVTPRKEIAHLLGTIAAADCRFIRNGKTYDAQAAHEHIRKKYEYLQSRIRSAEDIIRYAATRSSMSGEPYRVACGDRVLPCADWLRAELARFRRLAGKADENL